MRKLLLSILFTCSAWCLLQAQSISGIRVDAGNNLVLVYVNGKQISLPTSSCFIANLHQGRYALEVYDTQAYGPGRPLVRGKLMYRESVYYKGYGIKEIRVSNCVPDRFDQMNVLSPELFDEFYRTLKRETFFRARLKMLERTVIHTRFTCAQCKRILHLCDFDNERLPFMKVLYPAVVDKQNFFTVIRKFDFNANKEEMHRFIKQYHQRYR